MTEIQPETSRSADADAKKAPALTFAEIMPGSLPGATTAAPPETPANQFQNQLDDFRAIDQARNLKDADTVFAGSSTFANWKELETEFKSDHAINRSIGGTMLPDLDKNLDKLVLQYHPHNIVIYSGTNDLAAGHEPKEVEQDLEKVERDIHAKLPDAELYFVGPNEAPVREELASKYELTNKLSSDYLSHKPHCHYIDVRTAMHDANGHLKAEDFGPDHLHMNEKGYNVFEPIIKFTMHPELKQGTDTAP